MTKLRFELRQSVSGVCSHNHWANCLSVNHTYTWGEKSMTFMIFHRRVSFERYIYSNRLYGTHGTITTHHIANNLITTQPRHHVCPHHTSPSTTPLSTTRFTAAIAHRHHHQSSAPPPVTTTAASHLCLWVSLLRLPGPFSSPEVLCFFPSRGSSPCSCQKDRLLPHLSCSSLPV